MSRNRRLKTLIKNARIADYQKDSTGDVFIEDGKIVAVGRVADREAEIIDAEGKILMPAFADTHVHFRDPGFTYKEDLTTGAQAALAGGYSIVNLMGNTKPIVDEIEIYEDIIKRGNATGIHVESVFAVTKGFDGKTLTDIGRLPERVRFLSDDGRGILSAKTMMEALIAARNKNIGIMVHAEDPELSPIDYRFAEDLVTIRDIYLAEKLGARLHMSHVSTEDSIEAVRQGKARGADVTAEVTPHHFSLYDSDYRVNPPIRTKRDVEAVIRGLKDGTVDAIATDHAPHSDEDKKKGAPGMIGLETAFALAYTKLVCEGIITLNRLSELMSRNPARILGYKRDGIAAGEVADLVLISDEFFTVDAAKMHSKSHNTPFHGMELRGMVEWTMVDGEIRYRREV